EFKTGYPIFAYKDLFRFSFINQYENRTWDMNLMMRNSLQEEIKKENPYLYKKAHQFLYKYYNEKITNKENGQISREDWPYFREAFYHGNIIMEADDFLNWFLSIGKKLQDCGQFELISSYYNELIEQISNKDNEQASAIYQYFGGIGLLQGNYELALELLQKAATIYAKLPTKKREYLKCCNDLAEIMIQMTNFDQAYDYFSNAINSYQTTNSEELEVLLELALVYIRLGKLDIRFSK
ncbi:tetratricopeptide repeat protein, partial [Butyricicoccus sp. 1XD8-22]